MNSTKRAALSTIIMPNEVVKSVSVYVA